MVERVRDDPDVRGGDARRSTGGCEQRTSRTHLVGAVASLADRD
jgi:hypothetical protein